MAREIKAMVELTKMKSVREGGRLFSVRSEEELQNGFCVKLGNIEIDNPEVQAAEKATEGDLVALVAHPYINKEAYTRSQDQEYFFSIEEGVPARAYELNLEDVFAITAEAIVGEAKTELTNANTGKKYLVPNENKWKITDTNPDTGTVLQFVRVYPRTAPAVGLADKPNKLGFTAPQFYGVRVVNQSK